MINGKEATHQLCFTGKERKSKSNLITQRKQCSSTNLDQLSLNVQLLQIRLQLHSLTYCDTININDGKDPNSKVDVSLKKCCDPFRYHIKKERKGKNILKTKNLREISINDFHTFTQHGYNVIPGKKVCITCSDKLNDLTKCATRNI